MCNNCKERREAPHQLSGCDDTECDLCGRTVVAKGHSFGEWSVTKAPTVDADGEESRACSVCQSVETRIVPKLPATGDVDNGGDTSGANAPADASATVIVIFAVIILGGAGFAAYWFFIRKKNVSAKAEKDSDTSDTENSTEKE
jgi:hypothetical protein